jgi:hypothetical protein
VFARALYPPKFSSVGTSIKLLLCSKVPPQVDSKQLETALAQCLNVCRVVFVGQYLLVPVNQGMDFFLIFLIFVIFVI